jgi:hypothetical protein
MEELIISKLDSAKRQLEIAIKLYFHFDDPVSIHTLTAAAYNVLRDINKDRGNDPVLVKEWLVKYLIKPEKQKEFIKLTNEAENFFKHADTDAEETYTFRPRQTEILLWEAVEIYQRLTGEITPLIHLYRGWFMMHNLHIFDGMPEPDKKKLQILGYNPSERGKYFSDMIALAHKTDHG